MWRLRYTELWAVLDDIPVKHIELIHEAARSPALPVSPEQAAALVRHCELIIRHGRRTNLTGRSDVEALIREDVADSLALVPLIKSRDRLLDLGSGAGFPGIPIAICREDLALTLCEPRRKRAAFLRLVIVELGLRTVELVAARAEGLATDPAHAGAYDVVTARAVADLADLARIAMPLLRDGGRLLAMKGPRAEDEAMSAAEAIGESGARLVAVHETPNPLAGKAHVVVEIVRGPSA